MSDEPNRVRSFVEVWVRRVLTISGCVLIWLVLLAEFPLLFIAGAIIDLAHSVAQAAGLRAGHDRAHSVPQAARLRTGHEQLWVTTRCVLFFPFYFSCEVFGIIASSFTCLASGVWAGASRERFLDRNFAFPPQRGGMFIDRGGRGLSPQRGEMFRHLEPYGGRESFGTIACICASRTLHPAGVPRSDRSKHFTSLG